MTGLANIEGNLNLGGGAQFWVYISPQNNTVNVVKNWSVTFSQGNWMDSITSENPTKQIQTPNLSGLFDIKITEIDGSTNPPRVIAIPPMAPSTNQIGCNSNCASMVGIVANETILYGGPNATFWTTWDAVCRRT
ncbi:MAG: hypothetical protein K2P84_06740 [Undibacterium sp.]|nr:hypothetical protein [Undibacterium sp.]